MLYRNLVRSLVVGGLLIGGLAFVSDRSSATAAVTEAHPTTLPSQVDLRPRFKELGLTPRRQGARGTCSVFTTAAAMEFAISNHSNQKTVLSPEFLNWAADKVMNYPQGDGHYFHDLIHGYEKFGVCPEDDMPYTAKFDSSRQPSADALRDAKRTQMTSSLAIHWIKRITPNNAGLSTDQMKQVHEVLAGGLPVAAGASHSRLLVGYHDDPAIAGGGYFITKDSALGRYSTVTYEFVATKVNDAYWVSAPPSVSPTASAAASVSN